MKRLFFLFFATFFVAASLFGQDPKSQKPRVIVTCDPELDDQNSLIRYLLFSTDFDTEGLVTASSRFHWKGDGKGGTQYIEGREYSSGDHMLGPQTQWRWTEGVIAGVVDAYEQVYPNLAVHNPEYPTPEFLRSIIREGNVAFEGDMAADTPGSDLIKQVLLDDDPRPVYIQIWGGPSTASRALKSIEDEYKDSPEWERIKAKVSAKAKFCLSGNQDMTFQEYVQPNWPDVESVIINAGVISMGYATPMFMKDNPDSLYFSAAWTSENVRNKGVFGEMYRVWGDGKHMVDGDFTDYFGLKGYSAEELRAMGYMVFAPPQPEGTFLSEGDTPMYLNIIDNGLRAYESQEYGGWAGRRRELSEQEKKDGFTAPFAMRAEKDEVLPSFVAPVQNSFAARLFWSVTPNYEDANHFPVVNGPTAITAAPGETIKISTEVSDPDGDNVTLNWMQFKVGSYKGDANVDSPDCAETTFTVPADAKSGDTIHLILQAMDDGEYNLVRYLRTIVTVE